MVVRGKLARKTIIVSGHLEVEVRGRWYRECDFHGDSGVTKATVIIKFGKEKPVRLDAAVRFYDAPVCLEAESIDDDAAIEEANREGERAVRTFLVFLAKALQHRSRQLHWLLLQQFGLEESYNDGDPRSPLGALELAGKLAKPIRIAYAYIHCEIALLHGSSSYQLEERAGAEIEQFAWDLDAKVLDLRSLLAVEEAHTALSAI